MTPAKRKKPGIALRNDSMGHLDDVVVEPVETFRAEFLDDNSLWLACYLGKNNDRITFHVTGEALDMDVVEMPVGPWEDLDETAQRKLQDLEDAKRWFEEAIRA